LGFNSLAAAALVVLAINPCDLFRVGAQLSFLCVAGLIWFAARTTSRETPADPLDELLRQNESWAVRALRRFARAARDLTLAGAMLWLLTLPLVMARFHLVSPAGIALNPLIWIPTEVAMLSGFATLLLGTFVPPLGWLCGVFCNWSLGALEWLVLAVRNMPGGHYWVPGPSDWWLWGFYGGLAVLAALPALRPPRRWCVALLAVWISLGFGVAWLRRAPPKLDCTFLSMNHGCAVLVELPDGRTLLYDAGRMGAPTAAAKSIAAVLWSRGITHLDAVVLSHADIDHYNALPELLDKFSVGVVYVSPVMFEKQNYAMTMLKESIEAARVPIVEIRAGDRLPGGDDCRIEVLHPPPRGGLGSENANSVVLAVEHLGHRIILPGDLEPPGLNDLLAEPPAPCSVLLAPHHGSRQTNAPGLAAWCNPRWVVISGSRRWDTRPIRAAYEAAGSAVLETIDAGAIHVRINREGVAVESFVGR
jgi:competence protein ComEC